MQNAEPPFMLLKIPMGPTWASTIWERTAKNFRQPCRRMSVNNVHFVQA